MPIYNGIEFIDESVMSIINQTYKEWELIIGVNGHQSESPVYNIAKKYKSQATILDLHHIKGKSAALNEMLKYCKYDWVSLLDVDDKWLPKKLESQLEFMTTYDVIGTNCKYFGRLNNYPVIPVGDIGNHNFINGNPVINSSCLLRKELCYWDGEHDGVEDYDLWLKLWRQEKRFYNVPTVQVLHRIHESSAFNAKGNHNKVGDLLRKYV